MITDANDTQPAMPVTETEDGNTRKIVAWDAFLSHLQDGYRNAQETIRAMDTKVTILTGLSVFGLTAVAGVLGAVTSCFGEHPEYIQAVATAPVFLLIVLGLLVLSTAASIVWGIVCIMSCLDTLRAHSRIDGLTDLPATVLFPHLPPKGNMTSDQWMNTHQSTKGYYDRIAARDFTADDVQKEYHDQILNVGAILGAKVSHFQSATRWFQYQIVLAGVVLVLLLTTVAGIVITRRAAMDSSGVAVVRQATVETYHPSQRRAP